AKYVGYMYGGLEGEASTQRNGLTSDAASYNETSSTIKGILDTWYKTNIFDQGLGSQVVDNLFCNDRQLQSEVGGDATGPGYGACYLKCVTHYAASYRIIENKTPTLKCGLKNDRFTTGTDIELGNGSLTYPVGLLTSDEASMAGLVHNTNNTTNYLYTNQDWWLLTPDYVDWNGYAHGWHIDLSGKLYDHWANYLYGARPSVSLISGVRVTGIGSANDPFKAL
ncbi:MAG: hypothetical protein PHU45_03910, partial [Bacilli bacterium]|nr:hypothetical protein [Bacilli bacterium]